MSFVAVHIDADVTRACAVGPKLPTPSIVRSSLSTAFAKDRAENSVALCGVAKVLGLRADDPLVKDHCGMANVEASDDDAMGLILHAGTAQLSAVEGVASVLRHVARGANGVVSAVPSWWTKEQRSALQRAAKVAGLRIYGCLSDSVAAAHWHLNSKPLSEPAALVRLGASGITTTIVVSGGTRETRVLATATEMVGAWDIAAKRIASSWPELGLNDWHTMQRNLLQLMAEPERETMTAKLSDATVELDQDFDWTALYEPIRNVSKKALEEHGDVQHLILAGPLRNIKGLRDIVAETIGCEATEVDSGACAEALGAARYCSAVRRKSEDEAIVGDPATELADARIEQRNLPRRGRPSQRQNLRENGTLRQRSRAGGPDASGSGTGSSRQRQQTAESPGGKAVIGRVRKSSRGTAAPRPPVRRMRRTGEPASRRTGEPASRRTGEPASSRTGKPASSRTGKPASSRTGKPASSRTGKPASSRSLGAKVPSPQAERLPRRGTRSAPIEASASQRSLPKKSAAATRSDKQRTGQPEFGLDEPLATESTRAVLGSRSLPESGSETEPKEPRRTTSKTQRSAPATTGALDLTGLSEGTFSNPTDASAFFTMALSRPLEPADIDPIALPVLLRRVAARHRESMDLILTSGGERIVVPLCAGAADLDKASLAALMNSFDLPEGRFELRRADLLQAQGQAHSLARLALDGTRRISRQFSADELALAFAENRYLSATVRPERRVLPSRMGLSQRELRFIENHLDGHSSADEISQSGGIGATGCWQLLALLQLFDVLQWSEPIRSTAPSEAAVLQKLAGRLARGTHFDVLEAHWSSTSEELTEAYRGKQELYKVGSTNHKANPEACRQLRTMVERAYETLKNDKSRAAYRRTVLKGADFDALSDLAEKRSASLAMKGESAKASASKETAREMSRSAKPGQTISMDRLRQVLGDGKN